MSTIDAGGMDGANQAGTLHHGLVVGIQPIYWIPACVQPLAAGHNH
jgi:hypothetical protein